MKYRILIADDEVDILEFIRYNLQREGYEVYTAENGAEALRLAREHHPHLILLDRMMPVMDGAQTCRAIRQEPELKQTMVVFLSALGEEEQQLKGFDAGADDYLTKPIPMKLLVSRVQALLKRVDPDTDTAPAAEQGVTVDRDRYSVRCNGHEITLPRKEFALLDLLSSSPGKLFSREESTAASGAARWSWETAPSTCTSASCARKSVTTTSSRSRASATSSSPESEPRPQVRAQPPHPPPESTPGSGP